MKRKIVKNIVIGITVSSMLTPLLASPSHAESSGFKDVSDNHWAKSGILNAVQQGIVGGYPDGLFHPDNEVSRAEFIKMTAAALKLQVETAEPSERWYEPFFEAATSAGIYVEGDFATKDWTKPMTRLEMVHIAVRAIGETGEDDYEFMYKAAKSGLISGTGDGNLNPDGTTTRAQAVAVIQRIQQVKGGATLPIDEAAVTRAEKLMNAEKDPWGRPIRTTNLPSNYKEYPYILEELPNEMYEMKIGFGNAFGYTPPAKLLKKDPEFTKENIDIWMDHIVKFGDLSLNIDYRTMDSQKWVDDMLVHILEQSQGSISRPLKKYAAWVKENQIIIEGHIEPEPSMIFFDNWGKYYVRSKVKFKFTSFKESKDLLYNADDRGKFKKNVWYTGYVDMEMFTNVSGVWGDTLKVGGGADLIKYSNLKILKK
ncbi:S-layer homology domain-containing protein [Paenibacillus sp. DYY-L-2]|uniref:S-layer homology domain-containing protein n=1 Tax=Paenibacillus sp. DYY-L-2 TaxID=3447013 RepID=UPI003F4FEC22